LTSVSTDVSMPSTGRPGRADDVSLRPKRRSSSGRRLRLGTNR
jgi:hypothetical protein